ncbi:MAG TPA: hypothetical protein VFP47_11345, partial [Pyrinomonadaceae bacterium]|nr:hypothetical protein [Pyrinomonadaceae bacterium]
MAYFGGYTDLMATAAVKDWGAVDSIEVMIGFDHWHPTQGTRNTIARNSGRNRMMVSGGRLTEMSSSSPAQKNWIFAEPIGKQTVIELPFAEILLISRHLKTVELHTYLSQIAVSEVLDPATPPPKAIDAKGRSAQNFVVEVIVVRGNELRSVISRGRDGYAVTAPL